MNLNFFQYEVREIKGGVICQEPGFVGEFPKGDRMAKLQFVKENVNLVVVGGVIKHHAPTSVKRVHHHIFAIL